MENTANIPIIKISAGCPRDAFNPI